MLTGVYQHLTPVSLPPSSLRERSVALAPGGGCVYRPARAPQRRQEATLTPAKQRTPTITVTITQRAPPEGTRPAPPCGKAAAPGTGLATRLRAAVGVRTGVGLAGTPVGLGVGVSVAAGVAVGMGVGVDVGIGVAAGAGVGVAAGVDVGTAVGVAVGVDVGTAVGVAVGVGVGTGVGVAVGVGVGGRIAAIWMLRSRSPTPCPGTSSFI